MKYLIFFIFFLCLSFIAKSQLIADRWYNGAIILNNRNILDGEVKLDFTKNLLHYKNDSATFTFLPTLVNHFKLFDKEGEIDHPRIFAPLKYKDKRNKETLVYFELMFIGKTHSLLAKGEEAIGTFQYPHTTRYIMFTFHLQDSQGNYKQFISSNPQVINLLKDEKDKIKSFLKDNSLNCKNFDDLLKVIEYYDQLKMELVGI